MRDPSSRLLGEKPAAESGPALCRVRLCGIGITKVAARVSSASATAIAAGARPCTAAGADPAVADAIGDTGWAASVNGPCNGKPKLLQLPSAVTRDRERSMPGDSGRAMLARRRGLLHMCCIAPYHGTRSQNRRQNRRLPASSLEVPWVAAPARRRPATVNTIGGTSCMTVSIINTVRREVERAGGEMVGEEKRGIIDEVGRGAGEEHLREAGEVDGVSADCAVALVTRYAGGDARNQSPSALTPCSRPGTATSHGRVARHLSQAFRATWRPPVG